MKILANRLFWGIVLILGGILFLLQNLGIFQGSDLFWGVSLAVAGILFLGVFYGDRQHWWALIPGMVLLSIGVLILLSAFVPGFDEGLGGLIILAGIGLGFIFVYLADHAHWWALIPGGILVTLGIVAASDQFVSEGATGGILFVGFGLTFLVVALAPNPAGKMRWALVPAVVLAIFGLIIFFAAENMLVYILPLAFIIAGGVMVWRALRSRQSAQP